MAYAYVRNLKTDAGANLKTFAQIQSAERHAKRQDNSSLRRQRYDADHRNNYFWSTLGEGLEQGGADYAEAFRAHKSAHGVKSERKNSALAMHLLVGVSPDWLSETGDPRSLENPRVKQLISEARLWAESWMGDQAVWAVRYDTDETGSGVVDILASPVRPGAAGRGKPKPQISVNKAMTELRRRVHVKKSYEAMQTDWAVWMQQRIDPSLKRGEPSEETQRKHVSPEVFKEAISKARTEALRGAESAIQAEVTRRSEEELRALQERAERQDEANWRKIEDALDAHIDRRMNDRLRNAEDRALKESADRQRLQRHLDVLWRVLGQVFGALKLQKLHRLVDEELEKPDPPTFRFKPDSGPHL